MSKEIWLPKAETSVRVTQDGTVTVWDDMTMTLRPIAKPTGFTTPDTKEATTWPAKP